MGDVFYISWQLMGKDLSPHENMHMNGYVYLMNTDAFFYRTDIGGSKVYDKTCKGNLVSFF